jgi:hypothetical protein
MVWPLMIWRLDVDSKKNRVWLIDRSLWLHSDEPAEPDASDARLTISRSKIRLVDPMVFWYS